MKKVSSFSSAAISAKLAVLILSLNVNLSAATLIAQWDLNEGSPATTITAQVGTYSPADPLAPLVLNTTSESFSTALGLTWGAAASAAPGSTDYLHFDGTHASNTLDTNVSGAALEGSGAKTFVAWINMANVPDSVNQYGILSYSPDGGSVAGSDLRFLLDKDGTLRGEVSSGAFGYNGIDFRGVG